MSNAFQPKPAGTTSITGTTTSASASVDGSAATIRLYNASAVDVFVRWGKGTQTAVVTDMPIAPGSTECFTKGDADTIAAITASGSSNTLYITVGSGE